MVRCVQQLTRILRSAQMTLPELGAKGFASSSKYADGDLKGTALIPENEFERTAIIYKPCGPAGQYGYDEKAMVGGAKTPVKIWLPTQETWINPLMGWSSSSDVAETSYHKMDFDSVESAQEFLRKQGIKYVVEEAPTNWGPTYRPKAFFGYGDNFSHKKKGLPDLSYLENRNKAKATLKKK